MRLFLSRHYADPFYKNVQNLNKRTIYLYYCILLIPSLPDSDISADYFSPTGVIAVGEKPDNLTRDSIEVMV
jgi:hypothetical protein